MRPVQHPQLAHLMRGHVIDPLHTRPVGPRPGKVVLDHPFTEAFGGYRHRVIGFGPDLVRCGRRDTVDHGRGKGYRGG